MDKRVRILMTDDVDESNFIGKEKMMDTSPMGSTWRSLAFRHVSVPQQK